MAGSRFKTVSTAKARGDLAAIVNRVAYGGEKIVLTRHGRPVAGIVPMSDILRLREMDETDPLGSFDEIPEGMSAQEAVVKNLEMELGLSEE